VTFPNFFLHRVRRTTVHLYPFAGFFNSVSFLLPYLFLPTGIGYVRKTSARLYPDMETLPGRGEAQPFTINRCVIFSRY
jgi:hypothetical protein